MPSPPTLDFNALLVPIPGENPAGEYVRYDGTYKAIEEARRADDTLNRGEWVRKIKAADWSLVIEIATEALATKTKDLQITAWLVEALVRRDGVPGLRDGLRLLSELQEQFWESLHPRIEGEAREFRAAPAPLVWLNEKLPPSIRQMPVTQGINGESYAWSHWKESREVKNLGLQNQEAMQALLDEGQIAGEQFDKAVESTSVSYYMTLFEDFNQVGQEYEKLAQVVKEHFGPEPSLGRIKEAIEECRDLVSDLLSMKGGSIPEPQPDPILLGPREPEQPSTGTVMQVKYTPEVTMHDSQGSYVPSIPRSPMLSVEPENRADALRRLAAVADYFRKTEPHSPVSYLVQRAVQWGEMPLEQWLQDVIHDESVLGRVFETLGLKSSDSDGNT